MTQHAVAIKLLEHGPLTLAQFCEIVGWPYRQCSVALSKLVDEGYVRRTAYRRYELFRDV
jgi:DNA-binding IclR family transcriptional regulator